LHQVPVLTFCFWGIFYVMISNLGLKILISSLRLFVDFGSQKIGVCMKLKWEIVNLGQLSQLISDPWSAWAVASSETWIWLQCLAEMSFIVYICQFIYDRTTHFNLCQSSLLFLTNLNERYTTKACNIRMKEYELLSTKAMVTLASSIIWFWQIWLLWRPSIIRFWQIWLLWRPDLSDFDRYISLCPMCYIIKCFLSVTLYKLTIELRFSGNQVFCPSGTATWHSHPVFKISSLHR
jgi:hypothetical protein